MGPTHFIGVDVGTGSARAGVFDARGRMLASAKRDITLWREAGDVVEQSSDNIWQAAAASVREAVEKAGLAPADIAGIGFDATCSLVVVGADGEPLPVGMSGDPDRNVIVWMDHRALKETAEINAGGHRVLDYVGGAISPEMETPKLLWLKRHRKETFAEAAQFFDLADYLTFRASGSRVRSICTVTCKWTYLAHEGRWDADYFRAIGLDEFADEGFRRIGTEMLAPGARLGGLTEAAAADFGLAAGTAVAAGMIDAHAGGIGTVGARGGSGNVGSRMAYVFGTSACTMASTAEPVFVDGIWGPYHSAMVPGLWLLEGGQSAAGAAIEQLVRMHPASAGMAASAKAEGLDLVGLLARRAEAEFADRSSAVTAAGMLHVVPEFLGNRAPFADPEAKAIIAGIGMETSEESLVGLYIAGLCSLGYGVRQIAAAMADKGVIVDTIVVSGGAARSVLVRQLLADACGLTVVATVSQEPVLLGSAMLGAVAAGGFADLGAAMAAMSEIGESYAPAPAYRDLHDKRFSAFGALQAAGRHIRGR